MHSTAYGRIEQPAAAGNGPFDFILHVQAGQGLAPMASSLIVAIPSKDQLRERKARRARSWKRVVRRER